MGRGNGGNGGVNQASLKGIEAGLERLMPRGLGEQARVEMEVVIDDLVASALPVPIWKRLERWHSVAAALVLVALGGAFFAFQQNSQARPILASLAVSETGNGIEVLEQMSWIEGGADFGMQTFSDEGEIGRGMSYIGVEEERVHHENTGYEVILQREFEAGVFVSSSL